MNLGALVESAFRRAPQGVTGDVMFTATDGRTTTGLACGVPESGSSGDGFKERQMVRHRARRLTVPPVGLAFAPEPGMIAEWAGMKWTVLSAPPLAPDGNTVLSYDVVLQR
jgi:hypothetical protein